MKILLIPCIKIVYRRICLKFFSLVTMTFMNDNVYWEGTGTIFNVCHFPHILLHSYHMYSFQ